MKSQTSNEKEKKTAPARVVNIIGIVLCVLMLPFLIVSMTLFVQSLIRPDVPPNFLGHTPLIVGSGSMEPTFAADDVVIVHTPEDSSDLEDGTIVCYRAGDTLITHRIKGREYADDQSVMYVTQGDANNTPDTVRVAPSQIVGTYEFRFKGLGRVILFIQTPIGMILVVVLPLILLFMFFYLSDRRRLKASIEAGEAAQLPDHNQNKP